MGRKPTIRSLMERMVVTRQERPDGHRAMLAVLPGRGCVAVWQWRRGTNAEPAPVFGVYPYTDKQGRFPFEYLDYGGAVDRVHVQGIPFGARSFRRKFAQWLKRGTY